MRAGRVRVQGVTTRARVAAMPDVLAVAEAAPAVCAPDLKEKLSAEGLQPPGSSADEFGVFLRAEMAKWGRVVKAAGVKPQRM